jgi:hypothetical protein
MASYRNFTQQKKFLDQSTIRFQIDYEIAQTAFDQLRAYNYLGTTGSMPTVSWICPEGGEFLFDSSSSELQYDGTLFSSLAPSRRRIFFKYLNHFVRECMIRYDNDYNP